jgi:cAMP-binding proteins - catabolite gene activator and regulatory subunit of cAMP-dependent protein kinases
MKNQYINQITEEFNFSHSALFKHLTPSEVERISLDKTINTYKKGLCIYRQNSRITGCYIVLDGILKVYKTGIDGKEQIIRFAKPYDIIGFRSVLNGDLACTTAKTLEDSKLCYITQESLYYLVKNNGNFAFELLQLACRELGEANEYITDIAQKTVRERLAEVLVHLKQEFGIDKENILQILLTREELANIVGTATESVIRLLSEFKNDNLIEIEGRKIKILNFNGLIKVANLN